MLALTQLVFINNGGNIGYMRICCLLQYHHVVGE